MKIKGLIDEDFVNYKKCCMTIMFPTCYNFKCGKALCQNSPIAKMKNIEISCAAIVKKYISNPLSEAICFQGLEPCDSLGDMYLLIEEFRKHTQDDIVIYTGYMKKELERSGILNCLEEYPNIIIKYGRYIPNQAPHYDEILGVDLASNNQYAERIS